MNTSLRVLKSNQFGDLVMC